MTLLAHLVCALSLLVAYILQTAIFSQMPLLNGTADLILLFLAAWSLQDRVKNSLLWAAITGVLISMVSAMPFFAPLFGYLGVIGISKLLQRKVWRVPILAMFIVTLLSTFFQLAFYVIVLQVNSSPISWRESLDMVILPSALLNLIFALPVYAIVNDIVGRISPLEVDA
jgi:rod shape-determining protein MreD